MTKKQLEEKVADLEKRVMELQSQLLTLSLQRGAIVPTCPVYPPPVVISTPPMQPIPNEIRIGDYPYVGPPPSTSGNFGINPHPNYQVIN